MFANPARLKGTGMFLDDGIRVDHERTQRDYEEGGLPECPGLEVEMRGVLDRRVAEIGRSRVNARRQPGIALACKGPLPWRPGSRAPPTRLRHPQGPHKCMEQPGQPCGRYLAAVMEPVQKHGNLPQLRSRRASLHHCRARPAPADPPAINDRLLESKVRVMQSACELGSHSASITTETTRTLALYAPAAHT